MIAELVTRGEPDALPAQVRVRWRYQLTMPANDGTIVLAMANVLTVVIKIAAEWPDGLSLIVSPESKRRHGVREWFYDRIFIPNEHLRLRWFKSFAPDRQARSTPLAR